MKTIRFKYCIIAFVILVLHQTAFACPVCFGLADSKTADANNNAIIFLLSVTGVVLAAVGAFFIFMWRRIRKQQQELSQASFVSTQGNLIWNNEEGVIEEWKNI